MQESNDGKKQTSPGFNLNNNRGIATPLVAGPGQIDAILRQNNNQPMTVEELMQQMPAGRQNQPGK